MEKMIRTSIAKIGNNRDKARIWIQGNYLELAGFSQGTPIKVDWQKSKIIITKDTSGDRIISGTKNRPPIIDLNTNKIKEIFDKELQVKVTIYFQRIIIEKTKIDKKRDSRPTNKTYGSVFSGIDGLGESAKKAGFKPKFAIEKEQKYADILQKNNPSTEIHNSDIAQVDYSTLPDVELLLAGIPCEPFSQVRRNYREQKEIFEEHETADLSIFFISLVEQKNPRTIVMEEVPQYLKSGIGIATLSALRRMGYYVTSKVVTGTEYGQVTQRKRAVILATTDEIDFPEPLDSKPRKLYELLLPIDHPDCKWFNKETKSWIFDHWEKQTAKGNNFASQQLEYGKSETVQAITRRYFAQQGGNPVVKHPTLPDTFRWLTLSEVKAIMGFDESYDLGTGTTVAGEGLGQSVLIDVFRQIISAIKPNQKSKSNSLEMFF